VRFEQKSEKIARIVVGQGNGCFRCVRCYFGGELEQTRRAEGVMLKRRMLRIALRTVERVYFLKNWSLCHEAMERDEKRIWRERREYQ
jgi:hypothetical protein